MLIAEWVSRPRPGTAGTRTSRDPSWACEVRGAAAGVSSLMGVINSGWFVGCAHHLACDDFGVCDHHHS